MLSQRPASTQADSVFMLCGNENIFIAYTLSYFLSRHQCHWPPGQVTLFPDSSLWCPSFSSKPRSCLFWRRCFHCIFQVVLTFSMITSFYIPLSSLLTNSRNIWCYVSKVPIRQMEGVESQFHTFLNLSLYGGKLCPWGNRTLYPLKGSLCGPQSWFEHFGVEKNHVRLPYSNHIPHYFHP
jgi:hypothetical protein